MSAEWKESFIRVIHRKNEFEFNEFVNLVDSIEGKFSADEAKVLMRSFLDIDDYGSQESVCRVLSETDDEVQIVALLEELPRLLLEAKEWSFVLVGGVVRKMPGKFGMIARSQPKYIINALRDVLGNEEFQEFYPQYVSVLEILGHV